MRGRTLIGEETSHNLDPVNVDRDGGPASLLMSRFSLLSDRILASVKHIGAMPSSTTIGDRPTN
jgi:hypothetical protein